MPTRRQRDEFVEFVVDQLRELGDVVVKRMFGGHGLYHGEVFFAIIHDGVLYLKTDDQSRAAFVERDSEPFRPTKKITLRTYCETPSDVLEQPRMLAEWARRAVEAKLAEPDTRRRSNRTQRPRRRK